MKTKINHHWTKDHVTDHRNHSGTYPHRCKVHHTYTQNTHIHDHNPNILWSHERRRHVELLKVLWGGMFWLDDTTGFLIYTWPQPKHLVVPWGEETCRVARSVIRGMFWWDDTTGFLTWIFTSTCARVYANVNIQSKFKVNISGDQ